jgi:hypothetical protein
MNPYRGAIFNKYKIVPSAHNSGKCNLLSSAYDGVQYYAGIRVEVYRMKFAAERNTQKQCRIVVFRSGHVIY